MCAAVSLMERFRKEQASSSASTIGPVSAIHSSSKYLEIGVSVKFRKGK
jgi:hypothetical protein